jgi:hypothetical protein
MIEKAVAASIAFMLAALASGKIAQKTVFRNRDAEFKENERSLSLTASERDWTIVHIRDDVGAIHNL